MWQFKRSAFFSFPLNQHDPDMIFELALEAGADDVSFDDGTVEIIGEVEVFKEISDRLAAAGITPEDAELRMIPKNQIDLGKEEALQVFRVIEELEDLDDVQEVYTNLNLPDEVIQELEAA